MTNASLSKTKIKLKKGPHVAVLSLKKHHRQLHSAAPSHHLKGKAAKVVDVLAKEGMREYKEGKTRMLRSLADLD